MKKLFSLLAILGLCVNLSMAQTATVSTAKKETTKAKAAAKKEVKKTDK